MKFEAVGVARMGEVLVMTFLARRGTESRT
jgi:hypothetical protein